MAPGGGQQPTILPPIHSFNMEQRTPTGNCARRGSFCPGRRPHYRPTGNRPNTTRKQPTIAGQPGTGRTPPGSSRPSQANREPAEHHPEAADHRRPTGNRPNTTRPNTTRSSRPSQANRRPANHSPQPRSENLPPPPSPAPPFVLRAPFHAPFCPGDPLDRPARENPLWIKKR